MQRQHSTYPSKLLFFEPTYGLANRLRAMASGLELAKKINAKLIFVWLNDHELNCPFYELFQPIENVDFKNKPYLWQFTKISNQKSTLIKLLTKLVNKALGFDFCVKQLTPTYFQHNSKDNIYKDYIEYRKIYIQTCVDFSTSDSMLQIFKPTAEIQALIDQRTSLFNNHCIGLHIRRTDHIDAILHSPLDLFIQQIDEEIRRQPDSIFYLSTDDPEVELQIKELYRTKVMSFTKEYSRNSKQGIKDALIDLFCLSKTHKIIGSHNSSFSEIAARIGRIELQIINQYAK